MIGRYVVRGAAGYYWGAHSAEAIHPRWVESRERAFVFPDRRRARAVAKRLAAAGETKRAIVVHLVPKRSAADERIEHATAFRFGEWYAYRTADVWQVDRRGAPPTYFTNRDEAIALARRLDAEEQAKGGGT